MIFNKEITITKTWKIDKNKMTIIKHLTKIILNHQILKKSYNFKYKTQKYELNHILSRIFYVLYNSNNWRSLGDGWNNIYKHYIKINKYNIFKDTYFKMLQTYTLKRKKNLRLVFTDTSFIYNKTGVDLLARNAYYKNKKCSKLFLITDKRKIPYMIKFYKGTVADSKILTNNLEEFTKNCNNVKYFLADTGFCSNHTRDFLIEHKIKPLIPKNIRNTKKEKKVKNMNFKEKVKLQNSKFTKKENDTYKKRIKIEHVFSEIKRIHKFALRYDKYIKNLEGFLYIYFMCKLD